MYKRTQIHHSENIEYHDTGNRWMLATASAWKNSVSAMIGGVSMLIGSRTLKSLILIEKIQPRMMVGTFKGNPSTTIISSYSPANVSEETDLIAFYDELSSLVHPKTPRFAIGGNMNAQTSQNTTFLSLVKIRMPKLVKT